MMAEYKHGSMDIRNHEKTFNGFVRMVTWGAVIAVCILIFMALVDG